MKQALLSACICAALSFELRRGQRAPVPARIHAVQGARDEQSVGRAQKWGAEPAHSQGRARTAAPDRYQRKLGTKKVGRSAAVREGAADRVFRAPDHPMEDPSGARVNCLPRFYGFTAMACCHCLRNVSRFDRSENDASRSGPSGIGLTLCPSVLANAAAELTPSTSVRSEKQVGTIGENRLAAPGQADSRPTASRHWDWPPSCR